MSSIPQRFARRATKPHFFHKSATLLFLYFPGVRFHDIQYLPPSNAILGFTALAAAHTNDPELVQDYLHKITTSGQHLLSLINDVLDMSRIESGRAQIENKEVHLPDVLHDLRTIVNANILAKNLEFFIDAVDVQNEDVLCDKLRLNQVLLNLLSNAIRSRCGWCRSPVPAPVTPPMSSTSRPMASA